MLVVDAGVFACNGMPFTLALYAGCNYILTSGITPDLVIVNYLFLGDVSDKFIGLTIVELHAD